jgi:hypothetical protein
MFQRLILAMVSLCFALSAQAATFTVSGSTLAINLTAANESVAITAGASSYTFALTAGTWSGTNSADATGNGTASLSAVKASFTAVTVDDGSTGNAVTFNTSGANTYASSFTVTLDAATASTITFNGNTAFTGSAAFSASTSRDINVASGAAVSVVDGALSLSANQQVTPTAGTFVGVLVNSGVLQSTGAGVVSVTGRGGNTGTAQYGVQVTGASARIQSSGSHVTVTGTGGDSSAVDADGLRLEAGGKITTTGAGILTIVGIGGGGTANTSTGHVGVRVFASEISTVDGALSITGTGGATTSSAAGGQYGIVAASAAQIKSTGNGTVTLDGRGGGAIGSSFNQGIQIVNAGTLVTAKNGLLTLIGTNGAGTAGFALDLDDSAAVTSTGMANIILQADNINLTSNTTINAGNSAVTLMAKTAGWTIDLGGTDSATQMGLTAAELARINTGNLTLGSATANNITVSASVALPLTTTVNLVAATINLGANTITAGTVRQTVAGQPDIAASPLAGVFGSVTQGSTRDLVFTLGNVGFVDLSGISASLTGADQDQFSVITSPAATVAVGGSTTFTIRYTPTTTGNKVAAVQISSNDPDESPVIINLTGNSLPEIAVERPAGAALAKGTTVGFNQVSSGSTTDQAFTIRNAGFADLTGIGLTINGANASEFSVQTAPPVTLAPGTTGTFVIRFAPMSTGAKTAALRITSNDPVNSPFDLVLYSSSSSGQTVIEDFDYGGATDGLSGKNGGIGFSGQWAGTATYALTADSLTFSDLSKAGGSVTISTSGSFERKLVTPMPLSGTFFGSYLFRINNPNTSSNGWTVSVLLGGSGDGDTQATYNAEAHSYNQDTSGARVENANGNAAMPGAPLTVGSTYLYIFKADPANITQAMTAWVLTPGQFDNFKTAGLTESALNAATLGTGANQVLERTVVNATGRTLDAMPYMRLFSSSPMSTTLDRIRLSSTNLNAAVLDVHSAPEIAVEQLGADVPSGVQQWFAYTPLGSSSDMSFTIRSTGKSDLAITGVSFDGANADQFAIVTNPAASIASYDSTTLTLRFTPTSEGYKNAILRIASNDLDESPLEINIVGPGRSLPPFSGTFAVGPTGDYSSLTAAILALRLKTFSGPVVLELQPTYVSSVETFPLVFSDLTATAVNNLTVRPQVGASNRLISSADTTAATVDLNGARFVTFDGRPGGAGTAKQLTIENTSTSGRALRFINEASNNTIKFVTLQGVNTSTSSGTVVFSTTTGANGNDSNTIDTCDIRDGTSTPRNGIYSLGTASPKDNSDNTVSNCNLFNFYGSSGTSCGVQLAGGNTDWTISGNSFYQTATRTAVTLTVVPIFINNTSGNNFTITGNFIGGTAPSAGGTPWRTTGTTASNTFQGIRLSVGTTTPSSVQGNVVSNMVWTSNSTSATASGVWSGIYVQAGNANIGTVTGNTIGSGTGTGSISVTTSGNGGTSFGISVGGTTGTRVIANNTIGSITVNGSATNISASLVGIQLAQGTNTVSNNLVGSTTSANSLNAATASTSTTGQQVTGIVSSSTVGAIITGNTVANLNNNYAGTATAGQVRGIVTSSGGNTITGNTVRNLSTTSANPSLQNATASVQGIRQTSTTAGQTVSQNVVHSLANTSTAGVEVTGIYYAGPITGTNIIARNLVHSLSLSTGNSSSILEGILFQGGAFNAQNNMVRVGLDGNGASTAGVSLVRGILDDGTTEGRNFYHNSVYVGGSQTSASNTFAFSSTGATNARTFQNNILVNARSNSGGTGKHYAVQYGGTTVNPTGLTAGGNLFLASGTGGVLGLYNSADQTSLAAWQTATGQDAASLNIDPLFIAPTGTSATVDLHAAANSPANNAGLVIASVTDDFDGSPRSSSAPDIGADEILTNNANLASLSLDSGPISPVFAAATTSYTSTVPNGTTTVSASVSTADNQASVLITGGSNLVVGANTLTIIVTSPDTFTTKTYTVTLTRNTIFHDWAAANSTTANNTTLPNFAFGTAPGSGSALVYTGTFAGGGAITANGTPITASEPTTNGLDFRALFVRRKDYVAAGLTYTPQFSANLTTWADNTTAPTVLADDGIYQIVSVPYPPFIGGKKARFFQVSITVAP